jgi:hypothetical protein
MHLNIVKLKVVRKGKQCIFIESNCFFQAYRLYEEKIKKLVVAVEPLLDLSVADTVEFLRKKSILVKMASLLRNQQLKDAGLKIRPNKYDIILIHIL